MKKFLSYALMSLSVLGITLAVAPGTAEAHGGCRAHAPRASVSVSVAPPRVVYSPPVQVYVQPRRVYASPRPMWVDGHYDRYGYWVPGHWVYPPVY